MSKRLETHLPLLPAICERWSPITFDSRPIPEVEMQALLEAMRWAPSCFNAQPWQLLLTYKGDDRHSLLMNCLAEGNQSWSQQAPVLMLTVACLRFAHNGQPNRHAGYDLGQAVAQLALQAASREIYLHQMGGFSQEMAREAFALTEDQEPYSVIALGYLGNAEEFSEALQERQSRPRQRKEVREWLL